MIGEITHQHQCILHTFTPHTVSALTNAGLLAVASARLSDHVMLSLGITNTLSSRLKFSMLPPVMNQIEPDWNEPPLQRLDGDLMGCSWGKEKQKRVGERKGFALQATCWGNKILLFFIHTNLGPNKCSGVKHPSIIQHEVVYVNS